LRSLIEKQHSMKGDTIALPHNLDHLPEEILWHITSCLDWISLLNIGITCKAWRERSIEPNIWRALCADEFGIPAGALYSKSEDEDWIQAFREITEHEVLLPDELDDHRPTNGLRVSDEGLTVSFEGVTGTDQVIFGNRPLCSGRASFVRALPRLEGDELRYQYGKSTIGYFELTIALPSQPLDPLGPYAGWRKECVAIGLADKYFPFKSYQPGWRRKSYGYHSDDGKTFNSGLSDYIGPTFGPGDTVGCGWNSGKQYIFFTKNGKNLGTIAGVTESELFPVIGMDTLNTVHVNFGAEPFVFDLNQAEEFAASIPFPPPSTLLPSPSAMIDKVSKSFNGTLQSSGLMKWVWNYLRGTSTEDLEIDLDLEVDEDDDHYESEEEDEEWEDRMEIDPNEEDNYSGDEELESVWQNQRGSSESDEEDKSD